MTGVSGTFGRFVGIHSENSMQVFRTSYARWYSCNDPCARRAASRRKRSSKSSAKGASPSLVLALSVSKHLLCDFPRLYHIFFDVAPPCCAVAWCWVA
eukprot:scaffold7375_cov268-Pinguiococcus_pyrenoidosus.AAC.23